MIEPRDRIAETVDTLRAVASSGALEAIAAAAAAAVSALNAGGTVIFFGNGGSAAEADHLAAELSGRFQLDRPALAGLALGGSVSALTAIANDYGYSEVFSRPLAGLVRPGDVAVGLTTSGTSPNVIAGLRVARERGATAVAFVGEHRAAMDEVVDICVSVPSRVTARVQEAHLVLGHLLCELVEAELFGS